MLINISTKYRILIIMILSQIGFISISIFAILSDYKISGIIALNIFFAIIVGYISFYSMQRIVGGIDRVKEYIEDLMDFVFFKTN